MRQIVQLLFITLFLSGNVLPGFAEQQSGETVTVDGKRFRLLSENLIFNPGFESGFTGWTDATPSAAQLSSGSFSVVGTGGVNNSKYLVGTKNEGSASVGSIGTGWGIESGKTYYFSYQVKYLDAATAAGSETWLKVSLTHDKTASAEPFILCDAAQVESGGKWTQNALVFTNSNPAYSFVTARFRWLNNRFGFDEFALYEVSEVPNTDGLQETIDEALELYNPGADGAAELQAAIATAQGFLSSESPAEVLQAIAGLKEKIIAYKYGNASPDNPLDMTSYIVNPGFNDNSGTGWTGVGTVNYHEVEFYQSVFDMYQQIEGLPAGKYRMKTQGFERPKSNDTGAAYKNGTETIYARFYAKATDFSEKSVPFNSIYSHTYSGSGAVNGYVNNMAGAEIMFNNATKEYYETTLSDILVNEGGVLTIGAKTDFQQTGYWALFDNFRLEYIGAFDIHDIAASLEDRIAEAQELLAGTIQTSVAAGLNAAITQAQQAVGADPLVPADVSSAKNAIDAAIKVATASANAYAALQTAIDEALIVLGYLDKQTEIDKLQNAIDAANVSLANPELTLDEIAQAVSDLKAIAKSVGKQIYIPTWMLGDVTDPNNNWSYARSKQSKNWILFWEPGFGDNPSTHSNSSYRVNVDEILALADKSFDFYTDSLKFIKRGSSKTDKYKMIIRLRYTTDWEASGSGVDNTIGLLTLTPWAALSRSGQTAAHEVGHCFQYQVHCDNNDQNGWMYGFGDNASGGCGWWEQCAQWQAYKIFPGQQFSNEWFSGYMNNAHKHILHEAPRYENFFIQDYWCDLHGMDFIGRLWNESKRPEDPVETYKRITKINQTQFNDEMYDCATRFASWDIPAIRSNGQNAIGSRPQPKMNRSDDNYWIIDPSVCPENYGHNIIQLNVPQAGGTVKAFFEGKMGADGFRRINMIRAGWRYGFVALKKDGTRVYGDMHSGAYKVLVNPTDTVTFECPANCSRLWFVVSGAPSTHWRHPWDDDASNDEQWPYQVKFNNTNLLGYTNIPNSISDIQEDHIQLYTSGNTLYMEQLPANSTIRIYNVAGNCLWDELVKETTFSTDLPSGIYIINIQSETGNYNRKIMIR